MYFCCQNTITTHKRTGPLTEQECESESDDGLSAHGLTDDEALKKVLETDEDLN